MSAERGMITCMFPLLPLENLYPGMYAEVHTAEEACNVSLRIPELQFNVASHFVASMAAIDISDNCKPGRTVITFQTDVFLDLN